MNSRRLVYFFILLLGLVPVCHANAQETEQRTHAESMSKVWKGMNVDNIVDHDEYATNGKRFYLYNVGTGRFVIEGGNWGMEGRLFHESFGRPLYLMSSGFIKSGITEGNNAKDSYGCNVPGVSKESSSWSQYQQYSFTVMMDADRNQLGKWQFKRVETDPNAETYTYYMWENMTCRRPANAHEFNHNNHNYYLGAAWGEWHVPETLEDGKGDGYFIFLDDDRTCWTTATVIDNTEKKLVNGEMISIDKLYQWRLVPEEEFIDELRSEKVGLNPSISSLVPDRDFTRNADGFDDNWLMEEKEDYTYGDTGRRGFTNGIYKEKKKQDPYYTDEAWDKPVRLKEQFGEMKTAKYGYLFFEGVGRTYTEFVAPRAGWYLVQCYGFVKSDGNNDAYLFAKIKDSTLEGEEGGESRHNLVKVNKDKFAGKNNANNCLKVGKELTDRETKENYKNFTWILLTEDQYKNNQRTIQVGVGKDAAFKRNSKVDGTTYYYDGDWVCIDDIRVMYMGLAPCFFYEDEEDLEYLRFDPELLTNSTAQLPSATPNGRYSGAACLERAFQTDMWNTFSFPFPLTGEQVRFAFGEKTKLAKLESIGQKSHHSNVIDFESVNLFSTDNKNAVEPGVLYLLKPSQGPLLGRDPKGNEKEYYELGRLFFSVNNEEPSNYTHPKMSLSTFLGEQSVGSWQNENDGKGHVNYIQTPDFANFKVKDGIYNGSADVKGIYAPKGSYAVSISSTTNKTTIIHLNRDTRIKGFRGWITVDHELQAEAKPMSLCIDGIEDTGGITTAIEELLVPAEKWHDVTAVYDLTGRKVGTIGNNLPKGMYIVKGKKFFVK